MKVQFSSFLTSIKPTLRALLNELLKEFDFASILASDSYGKTYTVTKYGTGINTGAFVLERGFVARVFDSNQYCEYAFSYIDEATIPTILSYIKEHLLPITDALPDGLNTQRFDKISEEKLSFTKTNEIEIDPETYGDDHIITRLQDIYEKGIHTDEHLINFMSNYEYTHINKMYLSKEKDLEQGYVWSTGRIMSYVTNGTSTKYYVKLFSECNGVELLDQYYDYIEPVCKCALELLDAKPLIPGEYDCICDPDVSGIIAHEAFGHGLEMDMFVKNRALAQLHIGQKVASDLVTMHDSACAVNDTGTYFFDDEGNLAQDTVIIEHGILKKGMNDTLTALSLNIPPTGNGRRERFDHKVYTRMTNTYIEPGTSSLDEMISSISYGFLLEQPASGMEDPKNWGLQCNVNIAREIKDGKLTGKIFSPALLTGYVPDVLKSISMVSNDLCLTGNGACGKGYYKEFAKVSCGGPYIKARIRLG